MMIRFLSLCSDKFINRNAHLTVLKNFTTESFFTSDQPIINLKSKDNIAIQALHWIERDFKEKFGDADAPHTKKLKTLRNAMEHKFVSIQLFPAENEEIKIDDDNIYHVSEDQLVEYTMDLMKLVREAIIELVVAISIEERKQIANDDKVASLTMTEYEDDFKR